MDIPQVVLDVALACHRAGGHAVVVGGGVRDHLMGRSPKDFDLEVRGLEVDVLHKVLRRLGPAKPVGRSFGVFKLTRGGMEIDIALPQSGEENRGLQDRSVQGDPHLSLSEAARRRDLTINAIAYDPLSGDLVDPFCGVKDIEDGILRAVDEETFVADPLRVLRVAQFSARFGFSVDPALVSLCQRIPIAELPAERIQIELRKLFLSAPRPSVGLRVAAQMQVLERLFPFLSSFQQDHAEAIDRAAAVRDAVTHPFSLMLSVWLSDCDPDGVLLVLDRIKVFSDEGYRVRDQVLAAVAHWRTLVEPASPQRLQHLAEEGEVDLIAHVAWAVSGSAHAMRARELAAEMGIAHQRLPPLLYGRDLAKRGIPAGRHMGVLLKSVRRAQLDGVIENSEDAIVMALRLWSEAQRNEV